MASYPIRDPRPTPRAPSYSPASTALAAPGDLRPVDGDPGLLHALFEAAVRRWPHAVAVDVPPGRGRPARTLVTYAELDQRAEAVAARLRPLVVDECVVAILLPRDSELLYAAQLGVLKAGAAYASIEPSFPDERIDTLLADSGAVAVLTDAAGRDRLRGRTDVDRIIDARTLSTRQPTPNAPRPAAPWLTPASLAYVIYTSGTTGIPKGVLIEHRSIANLVASDRDEFGIGPGERVAQNSSAAYDSSVEEIWLALAAGATLVLMDDDAVRLGPDMVDWLRRERITVFCPSPTLLRATGCRDPERALPDLRLLYVGGEKLPRDLAERWAAGRRLENGYGPTECAVTATRTRIHPDDEISIGLPIPNVSACVLSDALHEVPDGERGELCLGGIGVARGYHNRPELTAERFPVHPTLGRIYRTGDLAHRTSSGVLHLHGRIDSQVKVRGHRVELEEIETHLAACDGVREAACCMRGTDASQVLVAFVVPEHADAPPDERGLRDSLRQVLPAHMVPARISHLATLPRTTGGKLDRRALPAIQADDRPDDSAIVLPRDAMEQRIAAIFAEVLEKKAVSVTSDFFIDLGGDSISAAVAMSMLRDDPATASVTVRDIYDHPTVARLAAHVAASIELVSTDSERDTGDADHAEHPRATAPTPRRVSPPVATTLLQSAWLLKDIVIGSFVTYALLFRVGPAMFGRLGLIPSLLLLPPLAVAGLAVYTVLAVLYAAWMKRALIGRYTAMRAPVWGSFYLKHWIVERTAALIPWRLLEGTEYQKMALRALGARIGQRVHIHRAVDLEHGGWDLLDIGDDVTLRQNAAVRLVELESREMIVGPVVLGNGCTIDVGAGVHTHSCVEPDGLLTAQSSLPRGGRIPRGERWDGIPARPAGLAPVAPVVGRGALSPVAAGNVLLLARLLLAMFLALPAGLLAVVFWRLYVDGELTSGLRVAVAVALLAVLAIPLTLVMEALACRAMGRVREGTLSRWSAAYVRIWFKPGLVESAQRWLYGTLFWPHWLRLAGAKVGRDCEISSLIDALPETIEIDSHTFCVDGIYLGGARVHRGSVTIEPVSLASRVFLGNGALVPAGCRVPEGTLLGINTVADPERLRPDTGWFGHPAFQLPRRQIIAADAGLTEHPSAMRYASRVTWELLRFALAIVPALAALFYFEAIEYSERIGTWPLLLTMVPLVTVGVALVPVLVAITAKWLLLGRVRPATHPLWSCWNSRWDYFCVIWNVYAGAFTQLVRGTVLLAIVLRAIGVRVGRGVVLGGRFAEDVPDPDMLTIEDGATLEGGFQAHTFEDRVLKNGPVVVRAGATVGHNAVLLYGADIGADTRVAPHSVVMKSEHLLPGTSYEGFPTRRTSEAPRMTSATQVENPLAVTSGLGGTDGAARPLAEPGGLTRQASS